MKSSNPVVRFHLLYPFTLAGRMKKKAAICAVFQAEGKALDTLDYIFCSDDYLLKMNQEYLNHDTLTDILTFDLSHNQEVTIGEVYISIPRVMENAQQFNITFEIELQRIMLHGALHLCGYRDKTQKDIALMRQKENFYLAQ